MLFRSERAWAMLGQRSGRIILGNPEAENATVIRLLQQPKGGAGYCDSLDILLQWNSAPFTAGDAIPLSIQIKGAGLVIRAFLSRFEIPRPRPSSKDRQRLAFVGFSQLQQALVLRSKSKLNSFHCRDGAAHYCLPELSLSVFCLLYALLVGFLRN